LTSSMFNIANLFTNSDQGALFAGRTKQNPSPGRSQLPLLPLHLSRPSNLRSILPIALWLASGRPSSGGSPLRGGWSLYTDSTFAEVESMPSRLCLRP